MRAPRLIALSLLLVAGEAGAGAARPSATPTTPRASAPRSGPRLKPSALARPRVRAAAAASRASDRDVARMRRTLAKADPSRGIRQITGKDLRPGQRRFDLRLPADPYVDVLPDGRVQIYGTFESFVEFDGLDDFLRGGPYRTARIPTDHDLSNEASWDHLIHRWPGGEEVMYGGVITPTDGRTKASFPADNWTRRIYAYRKDAAGKWVLDRRPLFNDVAPGQRPSFLGHSYGHHFRTHTRIVDGKPVTETWLYHEEVVAEQPLRTEMFARRMLSPYRASSRKVKILGVDPVGAPEIGRRSSGDYLVEGPRPFEVTIDGEPYSFVSFSSGDYSSDNYDINFAWRKGGTPGLHTPILDPRSPTPRLKGFGQALKARYDLSWLGRAHVIRDARGTYWAVFHAVDKRVLADHDYTRPAGNIDEFQRNTYAVPLRFGKAADGTPEIEVLDRPMAPDAFRRAMATTR
jgi:hypothetical protein